MNTERHVVLGFAVSQPADSNKPIYVTRITRGGIADRCGLRRRDEIIAINSQLTLDMTQKQITAAFTLGHDESVKLEIRRRDKMLPIILQTPPAN